MDSKKSVFRKPVSPLSLIVLFVSFACFAGFYGYKFYIEYQDALIDAGVFPQRAGSFWRRDPAPNNLVTAPAQITLPAPTIPNFPPSLYDGPAPTAVPPTVETPDCLVSDFDWILFEGSTDKTQTENTKNFGSPLIALTATGKPSGPCAEWILGVTEWSTGVGEYGIKYYASHVKSQEILFVPNLSFFFESDPPTISEISQPKEQCSSICLRDHPSFSQPFKLTGLTYKFFKDFKENYKGRVFKIEENAMVKTWMSLGAYPKPYEDWGQKKGLSIGEFGFRESPDPSKGFFYWPNGISEYFQRVSSPDLDPARTHIAEFSEKIKQQNLLAKIPMAEFTRFECTFIEESKRDASVARQNFVSPQNIQKSKILDPASKGIYLPPQDQLEGRYENYKQLSEDAKKFEKENGKPCKPGTSLNSSSYEGDLMNPKSAWLYNCYQDISKEDFMKSIPMVYLKVDDLHVVCENLLHNTRFSSFFAEPIIYVYSKKPQELTLAEGRPNLFMITRPQAHQGFWRVETKADGTLWDIINKINVPYLFWEGLTPAPLQTAPSFGFQVESKNLETFFDTTLVRLGLVSREVQDFKKFWIPELKRFPVDQWLLSFLPQEHIEKFAPLNIEPRPDTLIRVFMDFQPLPRLETWQPQHFSDFKTPIRQGLTVVEWGGTKRRY
jgi:hypothetical protein